MVELPTGTVTFLFTDIERSTALVKRLGARYQEVLAEHQRIIRAAAEQRGGREIDTQGDSFFFAFPRANAALGAAVVAQRELAAHAWPEGVEVRVRMGIHTGEPVVGEHRYIGLGVHRAARIGAVAHGGQVLLSNATRELVEDELHGVTVRELGSYRLKDIDRPERLYQLDIEGLRTDFPPLNAEKVAEPHRVSRRTVLGAALAAVLAAAVAIPIFALGQGGSGGGSIDAAAGNSVAFVDAGSNELVADVSVGTTPTDVLFAEGALWVTNTGSGTVERIVDVTTRPVRQTIPVGSGPAGIASGDGSIWVANSGSGTVSRVDPGSNAVTATIPVGNGPSGVAYGGGAVWVANRDSHTVSKIDPVRNTVVRTVTVGIEPLDIAAGAGGIWVTSAEGRALRIDPGSGTVVETVGVGRRPGGVAVGSGSIWVSNGLDGTVSRIDSDAGTVKATVETGEGPAGVAVGPTAVWVANEEDGTITRVDPQTNAIVARIAVGGGPAGVAATSNGVYVAIRPGGAAHRGGALTVFAPDFETLDVALGFQTFHAHGLTNDGLTTWKRVGGQEGTQLVPNLATAIPQPTDGGRTYTFRIRQGIRYSTGEVVRAADFRRAFERLFTLNEADSGWFAAIPGAAACRKKPKACDLSRAIVTDDRAGTVTFRLTKPDPDLPAKLTFPLVAAVPSRMPLRDLGRRPLPATGPYMIASYVPGRQLRLVRNPHFREWSRFARPDGYVDEIVFKLDVPVPEQIRAVARGDADVADLTLSGASEIVRLRSRFGSRLRSDPGPLVVYTMLNVRRPPFDDPRVRRAFNLAVDRDSVARAFGGPDRASPTCQVLPPNYAGYEPYCPYERDVDEARGLVAASGTRGQDVVVYTRASYAASFAPVVSALRAIGYRARLKTIEDRDYFPEIAKIGADRVQASYLGWVAAIPSPAEYFQSLLDFLGDVAGYSDKQVSKEVARALGLQQTDLAAANEVWARVDRLLTDGAYLVPLYNPRANAFVSERVGNYQLHLFNFVLLDQLWVR